MGVKGDAVPPLNPEVFTVDEAAEYARVSPGKVRRWCNEGLKHWRTGSEAGCSGPAETIILREHLVGWIRSHAEGATPRTEPEKKKRGRPRSIPYAEPPEGGRWVK